MKVSDEVPAPPAPAPSQAPTSAPSAPAASASEDATAPSAEQQDEMVRGALDAFPGSSEVGEE